MLVPFNKPYLTGQESHHIDAALTSGRLSGNGPYTARVHTFFRERFGFRKPLLTTSCTDALEMAALLLGIGPGDEVIVPSYTFVSTANAFVLRGARLRFADSYSDHPNVDPAAVEALVTARTRAIAVVHYAGVACDMDALADIAARHGLALVEDAAQAITATYRGRQLGTFGAFAAFSFHETKNVIAGEGGLLVVNDGSYAAAAEIAWEKGTNRSAFLRGEVDKYGWVSAGSSYLPSEITAAFLYAQLQSLDEIQARRLGHYAYYLEALGAVGLARAGIRLPTVPDYAAHNAHTFYLVCRDGAQRDGLIAHLRARGIQAAFHYGSLHRSAFYADRHDGRALPHCDAFAERLVRLPLFYELTCPQIDAVAEAVADFLRTSPAA